MKMKNFFKQKNNARSAKLRQSRGFTLVETLVSISIFSLSIIAVMSFMSQNIPNTQYAKNRIAAIYLAQEGVEYLRNMRDNYVLFTNTTGRTWSSFRDASMADIENVNPMPFNNNNNFTRTMEKTIINSNEVKISSTVSWNQIGRSYNITLSEVLFNWME